MRQLKGDKTHLPTPTGSIGNLQKRRKKKKKGRIHIGEIFFIEPLRLWQLLSSGREKFFPRGKKSSSWREGEERKERRGVLPAGSEKCAAARALGEGKTRKGVYSPGGRGLLRGNGRPPDRENVG